MRAGLPHACALLLGWLGASDALRAASEGGDGSLQPADRGGQAPVRSADERRTLLLTVCVAFHGSTALEQVLMSSSSKGLATLCTAKSNWQCEGNKILCPHPEPAPSSKNKSVASLALEARGVDLDGGGEEPGDKRSDASARKATTTHIVRGASAESSECHAWAKSEEAKDEDLVPSQWNYSIALDAWSQYWDLSRPVLLEKTPAQWKRIKSMVKGVQTTALPTRMIDAGIRSLDVKAIFLWRPWCLHNISSHAQQEIGANGLDAFLALEHMHNVKLAQRQRVLGEKMGVDVLTISLADLMWRPEETIARVEGFLPELGSLDINYEPQLGVDVFSGNHWKLTASIVNFGVENPPETMGYDLATGECLDDLEGRFGTTGWSEEKIAPISDAYAHLVAASHSRSIA